jgi:sporulation protein YlmC with PRC-barrel domain
MKMNSKLNKDFLKKHCDSIYDTKNKFEEIVNIQDGSVLGKVVNVKADISRQNKVKISLEKNNDYDESSSYDDDLSCSDIDEI